MKPASFALPTLILSIVSFAGPLARAQMTIGDSTTIALASIAQAREILTARDDFVQRMSPFDRAARLRTIRPVSEEEYLRFVADHVLPWTDAEEQSIQSALDDLLSKLADLAWAFPEKVFLIKTTGAEEGGAAYTRANAVVLPQNMLAAPPVAMRKLVCHELFHVLSRANPALRDKLYAVIGFVPCHELELPDELKQRKISNPDAPRNDHCIRVRVDDREHWAVPIIFSRTPDYDPEQGGPFFRYLTFRLLLVARNDETSAVTPLYEAQEPHLVEPSDVSGFFEQIGRNTHYILHPEEILADNFVLLQLGAENVPSPRILERMAAILQAARPDPSNSPPASSLQPPTSSL